MNTPANDDSRNDWLGVNIGSCAWNAHEEWSKSRTAEKEIMRLLVEGCRREELLAHETKQKAYCHPVLSVVCVQSFACCVYRYGHFMI
jgi:hypothetical protein